MRIIRYALNVLIFFAAFSLLFILYRGGQNQIELFGSTHELWEYWQAAIVLFFLVIARTLLVWKLQYVPVLIFCGVMIVFLSNGKAIGATDTIATRFLPLSILREGNFDLNEFPRLYKDGLPSYMLKIDDRYISSYPVGSALLAVPFYVPTAFGSRVTSYGFVNHFEKFPAAIFVAASALFLYATLCLYTSGPIAILLTLIYAFGTSSFSVSSQALWQHGASQLCICAAIYFLAKASKGESRLAGIAGFPMSMAVLCRPTDGVIAAVIFLYVCIYHRKEIARFLLFALPAVLFQTAYNYIYLHQLSPLVVLAASASETPIRDAQLWKTPLFQGLTGLLFSPARGLFVYSPIFLFSIIGCAILWRAKQANPLMKYLTIGALLVILLYSKWSYWWGGESYGPRLLADIAPLLTLFLFPIYELLKRHSLAKIAFFILTGWSVLAHAVGAFAFDPFWNQRNRVDESQAALWQWKDNQLVDPIRNFFIRNLAAVDRHPNSRTAPESLRASYIVQVEQTASTNRKPIELSFVASNTGKVIWLSKNGKAGVKLVCEWTPPNEVAPHAKVFGLDYDVYINQSYSWHIAVEPPLTPGSYHLLLGLSTGKISFAKEKIAPAKIDVDVLPNGGWRAKAEN